MPPELPETSFKSLMGETVVSVQHWLKKKGGGEDAKFKIAETKPCPGHT